MLQTRHSPDIVVLHALSVLSPQPLPKKDFSDFKSLAEGAIGWLSAQTFWRRPFTRRGSNHAERLASRGLSDLATTETLRVVCTAVNKIGNQPSPKKVWQFTIVSPSWFIIVTEAGFSGFSLSRLARTTWIGEGTVTNSTTLLRYSQITQPGTDNVRRPGMDRNRSDNTCTNPNLPLGVSSLAPVTPTLLTLPARLDALTAPQLLQQGKGLLRSRPAASLLVLDFSSTTFIDSCGIGALTKLQRWARTRDIRLTAWSVSPTIEKSLQMTGVTSFLPIDKRTQALLDREAPCQRAEKAATHPSVTSPLKRALDILGALVGLSITAVVSVPIALAIALDSPGPILFSQVRRGWMGKPIRIWKFRTMVADAEARKHEVPNQIEGAFFKNEHDPRITRVGRFLRRTSLDEFPQFWNVLLGSMSLIGTRPPTSDEVEQYEVEDWQRLNVKPGLSGEWQVRGRSSIKRFAEVVSLDLAYQRKWSILYDLRLIWKTVSVLLSRRSGAC